MRLGWVLWLEISHGCNQCRSVCLSSLKALLGKTTSRLIHVLVGRTRILVGCWREGLQFLAVCWLEEGLSPFLINGQLASLRVSRRQAQFRSHGLFAAY